MNNQKIAVVIGGGPAGLTAAYELLKRTDIKPVVIEASDIVGGISCTINYKGNRIDIGGHRFFSKSDRVMNWWFNIMPPQTLGDTHITYHGMDAKVSSLNSADSTSTDRVMLVIRRKSRIYYRGKLFDYPISLSADTIMKLGLWNVAKIGLSYFKAVIFPIKNPKNLEEFYVNKFGRELYETFFEAYTEKVWGVPCKEISSEWGAQRVKGLSITKAVAHAFRSLRKKVSFGDKRTETSLIEQFLYPKFGPGHMWEEVANDINSMGGVIHLQNEATTIHMKGNQVIAVSFLDRNTGATKRISADYVFSTMPIKDLISRFDCAVPEKELSIATNLSYRDFITVGILSKKLSISDDTGLIEDNWIYIQEPDAKVGRIQIFNNWSPYMVADDSTVWLGLEYFCNEGDELWTKDDESMKRFAISECVSMGIISEFDVIDATVIRMKKTYPGYFGAYKDFHHVRQYLDKFDNIFPIGRNGMHKYNNQDHSMLTAMTAVDNILSGRKDKSNIWDINTEQDYHEKKDNEKS